MGNSLDLRCSSVLRRTVANPRIRSKKHPVFDLTPAEWLDRYYNVGRCDDPLREAEVVETLRITGAKTRIARYASRSQSTFMWAWARGIYLVDHFWTFEQARASAVLDLWRHFEYLDDERHRALTDPLAYRREQL